MISDNERREIARKLRGIDAERLDRVYGMDGEGGECSDPDMANAGRNLMLGAIAEAVGLHYAPYYFDAAPLRDRLADLIEPPTQCPYYHSDRHRCSAYDDVVDREALLALADELDENAELIIRAARNARLTGCRPTMEEAKHDAGEWRYTARRIREALGVEQ
ncbi:hypothetical protein H6A18_09475 [Collinsella tanakaei]|uniref:hypothetical protein n=1 Tax=Collinsella tanakaei TaxID=626935 RepID=UPI00195AFD80|nr:hypothetical protein [Collinsella tanakaei]MBM6756731.1 hypothetical protein [Collinsella tanakaei]